MSPRLLAFGESTVNGTGDPDHLGWVGRALRGRREVTLYNLGIRRETSTELLSRWRAETDARWTDAEPMRIVFSFGLNDCSSGPDGAPRVAPEDTIANMGRMLTDAARLAPALFVGPPPPADPEFRRRAKALNPRLAAAAREARAPFIDVFEALEADAAWTSEIHAWDGVHPGAGGYQAYADVVAADPLWARFLTA